MKKLSSLPNHCVKYTKMQDFPGPCSSVYGQNRICIFLCNDRIVDGKIDIGGSPVF